MLRNWAKLLPYWLVMKFGRQFGGDIIDCPQLGRCQGFRIDKGEWVLYSKQNYDRMSKADEQRRQTKLDKKKAKINKILRKDYALSQEFKKDIENEIIQEEEEAEYRMGS